MQQYVYTDVPKNVYPKINTEKNKSTKTWHQNL